MDDAIGTEIALKLPENASILVDGQQIETGRVKVLIPRADFGSWWGKAGNQLERQTEDPDDKIGGTEP